MALKAYGTVGNMDTLHFNKIGEDAGRANAPMAVMEGLSVSLVTGLTLSVAVGRSYQANSIAILDTTPIQKILGARSSGPRIDRVVLQVDFTKDQDTAATIEVVPGRAVSIGSPVAPQLVQDVLTQHKWQVPLARVLVPPTGALVITDERPLIGQSLTPFAALTIPTASATTWSQPTSAPLGVQRSGAWVELSGRLTFLASNQPIGTNLQFSNVPMIPDGYRPLRDEVAVCFGNPGSGNINEMIIHPNGTIDFWVVVGSLTTGNVLRVTTTSWIGA